MKVKGFIENIEGDNVYVVFDDGRIGYYKVTDFNETVKVDMIVEERDGKLYLTEPPQKLKDEIKEVTNKIFVPFRRRK